VVLEGKMVEIVAVCVFARREELRRVMTELVFQRSVDTHLVDYNYNIEVSTKMSNKSDLVMHSK
jgi:hypothetical protein